MYESRLSLTVDSRTGEQRLRSFRGELNQTEKSGQLAGAAMSKLSAAIGLAAAAAGGFGLSRVIRETTDFDSALRSLQATSRASISEMEALEEQARTLGATTMFSAKQTADAQQFLAMAGFEVNQILGATPAVLKLATAANMDLASAADIASNVLGGMRLEVGELDRVVDVLAATTSGSNTNIGQLGQALAYAAPLAASAGISIEEAAAAIGTLSDSGLQASKAGTGLVGVIRQLSNVTDTAEAALAGYGIRISDVDITVHGLASVLDTLQKANISTSDAFKIFGSEAGAAAQILAAGAGRVREFTGELAEAEGAASAMAQTIGGGLAGSWASFNSALSESILRLGRDQGVASGFQAVVDTATGLLSVYNGMLPEFAQANDLTETQAENLEMLAGGLETVGTVAVLAIGGKLAGSAAAAGTSMAIAATQGLRLEMQLAGVLGMSRAAAGGLYGLAAAGRAASGAMAFLGGPVGLAVIAAGSLYYFRDEIWKSAEASKELKEQLDGAAEAMGDFTEAGLESHRAKLSSQLEELRAEATALTKELEEKQLANVMYQGRPGANQRHESTISRELQEAQAGMLLLENQIKVTDENLDRLNKTTDDNASSTETAAEKAAKLASAYESLIQELDPAQASLTRYFDTLNEIDRLNLGERETKRLSDLALAQYDERMARIAEASKEGGKKAAEAFINPWQSAADTVAQSLQDAIASGDWDDIGDAIGGALGSSIAAIVNKQVTDSLAKDLTANSSTLAQIGGAFAGPIAGAVAGGAIQLAVSELSDFFSGSDWDPTAARQAAQGTGTVLGSIDAKSESIRRAVEGSESGIGQLVGINQNMLRALQTLQAGISGASTMVARGYGGLSMPSGFNRSFSGSDFDLTNGIMPIFDETLGAAFDFFDGAFDILSLGSFDLGDALGSVFGGSRKVKDLGIQFFGATLDEMIRGWRDGDRYLTAQAYASIEEDGGWFGSDDRWDDFRRLGPEAENQISLVFAGIRESVTAGAEALGMADGEINRALSRFRVATQKISLEDLSAEEQAAELEAVFGKIFDQAAGAVVPYLDDFQQAGEGLGETLSRVANQTLVTQEAVNRLGIQFSDLAGRDLVVASERLMGAAGGVEQFITSMQGFIGNFASEAQKFELAYSDINRALAQSNLQLPSTRDGYYDLLQAQNGATAAGAENIATLLRLQGVADDYYTFLEDAQRSAFESQIDLLEIQRSVITGSLRDAERASDAVARALGGLTVDSVQFARVSRDAALSSLQAMTASGRVGSQDELASALNAATNIQAGEFGTMNDYIRSVSRTGETLQNLKWVTDQQVTKEQRLLSNIERRIQVMNEEMAAIGAATAKHTAKTAKLLERIENNGVEIRE